MFTFRLYLDIAGAWDYLAHRGNCPRFDPETGLDMRKKPTQYAFEKSIDYISKKSADYISGKFAEQGLFALRRLSPIWSRDWYSDLRIKRRCSCWAVFTANLAFHLTLTESNQFIFAFWQKFTFPHQSFRRVVQNYWYHWYRDYGLTIRREDE